NLGALDYEIWDDGWTVATKDKKWTAQFEHTLVVTDDGAEILTAMSHSGEEHQAAMSHSGEEHQALP
ncbi:MAG: methionine aminopeptidase type, partial [Mycobacterium sp.]|nr:methionine aminopeptidase type [Mycobacterium sp.]